MKPPSAEHISIRVTGKVQQVLYRRSAQHVAQGLGISGYVQNNVDGSVSIEAEGNAAALEEFVRWCKIGPARAEVVSLDLESGGLQHFTEFAIR